MHFEQSDAVHAQLEYKIKEFSVSEILSTVLTRATLSDNFNLTRNRVPTTLCFFWSDFQIHHIDNELEEGVFSEAVQPLLTVVFDVVAPNSVKYFSVIAHSVQQKKSH